MKLSATREAILKPLQTVVGVVERKQTMPILSNVLLAAEGGKLRVTATDLEVEMVADAEVKVDSAGEVTVPGRKLHEICRAVPEGATVEISLTGERLTVKAGRSRFTLSTLRAADFPTVEEISAKQTLRLPRKDFRRLIDKTHFSMAQQDVRYYLNGLLLETERKTLRAVATDGHRLALSEISLGSAAARDEQLIVPRKGVLELNRLLEGEGDVEIALGANHIRVQVDGIRLTSKLIDGRFPEYARVVPSQPKNWITADRSLMRHALQRTAILSNEKYRGVRLELGANSVVLQANNPEQEEAVETIEVEYSGDALELGFNVNYLLDALAAIDSEQVEFGVTDANSACLIREPGGAHSKFVVMPMRL
jgi:DNA polymerase III subunit beta